MTLAKQGFNVVQNTDTTIFAELAEHPDREERYAASMTWNSRGIGLEPDYVLKGFDWSSVEDGIVVDIGGSHASLSIAIAQNFPAQRCIVQDKIEVVGCGRGTTPAKLADRVTFTAHDFFTEQPIKNAGIYILRWILHDWSDLYAMQILQALIPALTDGAKILVVEHVLPEPGAVSKYQERGFRYGPFGYLVSRISS